MNPVAAVRSALTGQSRAASGQHAIIDIGSNTVRLVVYGGPPRAPIVLHNEKVTAKLGRDLSESGLLPDKAMTAALTALARYAVLLDGMGVRDVEVVATAAARDAANGAQFLAAVRGLGLEPRLLSGGEEASASAAGVLAAFPGARGMVADLGGGSLELVDIGDEAFEHGVSLPLGTLRLGKLRGSGPAGFGRAIRKALRSAEWSEHHGLPLFLVGGSWRAFARFAMHRLDWPLDDPHGFELASGDALKIAAALGQGRIKRTSDLAGISASRLASLPDAAALLGVLVRELRPEKLVFSSWGLREGLWYHRLDAAERAQDPLLAGVVAFAEKFGATATLGARVAAWTAGASRPEALGRERLRLAATILAFASLRIEPNLRSAQAVQWALHKRWVGIEAAGRAMLAAAMLANAGKTSLTPELGRIAAAEFLEQALVWGLAIRLCRRFGACSRRALSGSMLRRDGGRLLLVVEEPLRALVTELVEKDLRTLADRLSLEPAIEFCAGLRRRTALAA